MLQTGMDELLAAGAGVVAISSSGVEDHAALVERLGLEFPVLSDPDGAAIRAYGLLHEGALPFSDKPVARPAVFVLDADRVIRRRLLTENWRVRVSPGALLEALAAVEALEARRGL